MILRNLYEIGGEQFVGCDCVDRREADRVAELASPTLRRVAVIRVHPIIRVEVTKV